MKKNIVLFVDDQEEILFLIKRMLQDEPYETLFANSAIEALEIIGKNEVDVLVTDVLMPVMGGLELLDIMQKSHPNVVRIILSGFSQIPTLLTAINRGKIFRYITKPWEVDAEAKQIIRDAIDYAMLIKGETTTKQVAAISIETLIEFVKASGATSVITMENLIVYVHPLLASRFILNQPMNMDIQLEEFQMNTYDLSDQVSVFNFTKADINA